MEVKAFYIWPNLERTKIRKENDKMTAGFFHLLTVPTPIPLSYLFLLILPLNARFHLSTEEKALIFLQVFFFKQRLPLNVNIT